MWILGLKGLTPLNCSQMHYQLSLSICYKNNFLLPPRPTREEWPFCFMKKQDISFTKEKYIYKNHYLVVSWQACAYQNEKLFHREWCRRSLTLIVSSYLEKYITTKTTSCNNKGNYLFIYLLLFTGQIFWTKACPEGMCMIGTQVPCEVPSLTNPTTRKGWPQHWGLLTLLFSNSGEIIY